MDPTPSKRLAFLEKLTGAGSKDPMAWYGLALEYRKLGRTDEALKTFETLRTESPDYVPMYLMAGQMLADAERPDAARVWLLAGIAAATAKGDTHAQSELRSALAMLD